MFRKEHISVSDHDYQDIRWFSVYLTAFYCYSITVIVISSLFALYYPTALCRVQITPKTSTNMTRYLYSRGPVRQVSCC